MSTQNNPQEEYWQNVLSNCFYLNYPGADGANKEYNPMRPLYPMLKELKRMGAVLVAVVKADGTKHYKLEQGTVKPGRWNQVKAEQLFPYREKLIWLFSISVLGMATKEGADEAERLFGEAMKKLEAMEKTEQTEPNLFSAEVL
jgi:hypothetical protein